MRTEITKLNRKIFASLPWGYRLAHLFEKLSFDLTEMLGRVAYAEFLKAGVQGLPDIKGNPALSYRDTITGPRAADKLPKGYGKDYGRRIWRSALARMKSPELVEEAVSSLMTKLIMGKVKIIEGADLKKAEMLILKVLLNEARMLLKKKRVRQKYTVPPAVDDEGAEIEIKDPSAFKQLERVLDRRDMESLRKDLDSVHPRARSWMDAQMEGLRDRELAEMWETSPAYVSKWQRTYMPAIKKVVYEHLQGAA